MNMKTAHGFRVANNPSEEEQRVARMLSVSIILLFGLIVVLHAISS
jgi:hypothetical protein